MASIGLTEWATKTEQKLHVGRTSCPTIRAWLTEMRMIAWATANSNGLTVDEIHFRSERQTLRRLTRSKVLLFTVRTYFEPVTSISQEPYVPGRLAEAIRNWDDTVSFYKGKAHWEKILLPYLDAQDRKQRESGMLDKQDEPEFPY